MSRQGLLRARAPAAASVLQPQDAGDHPHIAWRVRLPTARPDRPGPPRGNAPRSRGLQRGARRIVDRAAPGPRGSVRATYCPLSVHTYRKGGVRRECVPPPTVGMPTTATVFARLSGPSQVPDPLPPPSVLPSGPLWPRRNPATMPASRTAPVASPPGACRARPLCEAPRQAVDDRRLGAIRTFSATRPQFALRSRSESICCHSKRSLRSARAVRRTSADSLLPRSAAAGARNRCAHSVARAPFHGGGPEAAGDSR